MCIRDRSSGDSDSAEEDALPETPPIVDNVISAIEESTWGLPLRVAPVLKQFNAEEVSEYPLQQSVDGSKTTSLIVDDDLLRIIEARVDEFGQRRLNVSLTMNREITGFKHQHNGFLKQFEWVWIGSSIAGLLLLLISSPFLVKFLGITSALVGLILSVMTHLEIHRIEFSNNGGSHLSLIHI